jgi:pimeloyl-ACP methyl ester carboxylesterase
MALRETDDPVGRPWERPLAGRFERLAVESQILRDNPLGDPARRPLYVYLSPGVGEGRSASPGAGEGRSGGVPVVYLLQGYSNQLDTWLARKPFEPTTVERLDAMFAAGESPAAMVVFVDAWTSLGGSQFINSSGTGRYMDYLCDEIVPFVDERYPSSGQFGVAGHSSGGYGAMVSAMLRPDVFSAFASHAGDALFECCYLRDFPVVARTLRDQFDGSLDRFFERLREADRFDFSRYGTVLSVYAMAAAYSPAPGGVVLPFDLETGRLLPDVWARWLEWDPVRMAPGHAEALHGMRRIYLDAGRRDEYFLDLGARAFAAELSQMGVEHTLELFDGGHGGIAYRYPGAIRELVLALS